MTATPSSTIPGKRLDIQGLRAVAVLAALVFHGFKSALPGGFVGVDIFFVLSGYLITGILMREMDAGRFSLVTFYQRRVRRIFPALFLVMAVSLAVGAVILAPQALKELSLSQFFTTLFVSNLAFIRISGYFDADASLRPLLHTWSLGVEEQFYLLFPPILWGLHRFARRAMWPVLGLLALVSLWKAQTYLEVDAVKAFYHPFGRAVELLIGALCVGVERHARLGPRVRQGLAWAGSAAVIGSLLLLSDAQPFPGLLALPACLGTGALLLSRDGLPNRWLEARPLVLVGDMSYSLYLWHWPVLVYAHLAMGLSSGVTLVALALAVVLAWLSRRYVEEPFLHERGWPIWRLALAVMAVSIGVCVSIYTQDGLPQRFGAREQAIFAGARDVNPDRKRCHKRSNGVLPYAETCIYGDRSAPPSEAVWSDSLGVELSQVLGERLAGQGRSIRGITASGCPAELHDNDANCDAHNAQILAGLTQDANVRRVILIANYLHYETEPNNRMPDSLLEAAAALKAAGKSVVLIEPLPAYMFDPPSDAGIALRLGRDPRGVGMPTAQYDRDNAATIARLRASGAAHGITVVPVRDLYCDAARCRVYDPAVGMLYYNDVHLSLTGARRLADRLMGIPVPGEAESLQDRAGM